MATWSRSRSRRRVWEGTTGKIVTCDQVVMHSSQWTLSRMNSMEACGTYLYILSVFFSLFLFHCGSGLAQTADQSVKKTINIDVASGADGFRDDERFRDLFELTEENFAEWVLESEDPWIVVFTDGMLKREWKRLAVSLRGIVWFGMLHKLQQEDLLQEIDFDSLTNPPARVYPFGGTKQKSKWTDVHTVEQAREIAISSLPDITTEIDQEVLNDFILDSYVSYPTTFPAVFIVEKQMSPLFKSIAYHYQRYFNFGVIRDADPAYLSKLKYNLGIPGCFILISKDYGTIEDEEKEVDYTFQSIGYTVERQGELNYPNLVRFLYSVNAHYRHTLPGDNMADDEDVLRMEEVMEVEAQRFDVRYMEDMHATGVLDMSQLKNDFKVGKMKDKGSVKNEL